MLSREDLTLQELMVSEPYIGFQLVGAAARTSSNSYAQHSKVIALTVSSSLEVTSQPLSPLTLTPPYEVSREPSL